MTPSIPASLRMVRRPRRTLFVVSGVWLPLKNSRWSGGSSATTTSRSRRTSAVKLGTETTLIDFGLGMVLPVGRLPGRGDDRAADPDGRQRLGHVDIALADREDPSDPGRGAEHHLDDLFQLPIRLRP